MHLSKKFIDKIIHGDCVHLLKQLPDDCVDMVFADPPFNLKRKYKGYADNKSVEDYIAWSNRWLTELVRVCKPTGAIFVHNIPKWLTYYAETLNKIAHFKHWIVWDAPTGVYGRSFRPAHYGILCYVKDPTLFEGFQLRAPHVRDQGTKQMRKKYGSNAHLAHPFGPLLSDVWTDIHRLSNKKARYNHPCHLPPALVERLILFATREEDIILDPFMGVGTTAIAAKRLGRNFIGIEQSKSYINIAQKNLKEKVYQSSINKRWISISQNSVKTLRAKDWESISNLYTIPTHKEITASRIYLNSKKLLKCGSKNIVIKY